MKIDRQIGILSILLQKEMVTAPELSERFEVSGSCKGKGYANDLPYQKRNFRHFARIWVFQILGEE